MNSIERKPFAVRNDKLLLVVNIEDGHNLARVQVQSGPDGVAWSPVQRAIQ